MCDDQRDPEELVDDDDAEEDGADDGARRMKSNSGIVRGWLTQSAGCQSGTRRPVSGDTHPAGKSLPTPIPGPSPRA